MKKVTLALTVLLSLGLAACSSHNDNSYKGDILFSSYEGNNLKLTIRKNNCERQEGQVEDIVLTHSYDSNLVVGACVLVSKDDKGTTITNISRSKSSSWLSRTSQY